MDGGCCAEAFTKFRAVRGNLGSQLAKIGRPVHPGARTGSLRAAGCWRALGGARHHRLPEACRCPRNSAVADVVALRQRPVAAHAPRCVGRASPRSAWANAQARPTAQPPLPRSGQAQREPSGAGPASSTPESRASPALAHPPSVPFKHQPPPRRCPHAL